MNAPASAPVVRPPATVAMILGKSEPRPAAASPKNSSPSAKPARFESEAGHHQAGVREEMRRRHETPFRFHGWAHAGIND